MWFRSKTQWPQYPLYVDYGIANRLTCKDTFPLPHIGTSMDSTILFSTLDVRYDCHRIKDWQRQGSFHYPTRMLLFEDYAVQTSLCAFSVPKAHGFDPLCNDVELCLIEFDHIIVLARYFGGHKQRLQ